METEQEARDDAKIAATASQRPEQVRIAFLASRDEPTVGENETRLDKIIDGQAISARQIAVAAAQGKAGDASGGNDAGRRCQPERVRGMVHVALCAAGSNPRSSGNRVNAHARHR